MSSYGANQQIRIQTKNKLQKKYYLVQSTVFSKTVSTKIYHYFFNLLD